MDDNNLPTAVRFFIFFSVFFVILLEYIYLMLIFYQNVEINKCYKNLLIYSGGFFAICTGISIGFYLFYKK